MKARQTHLLGSLRSAHQFITHHAAALGAVPSRSAHLRLYEALERASACANARCATQVRARVEQFRGYAVGMAEAARPFTQQFVQVGLPADFADRMVAAAQAFLDAATRRRAVQYKLCIWIGLLPGRSALDACAE